MYINFQKTIRIIPCFIIISLQLQCSVSNKKKHIQDNEHQGYVMLINKVYGDVGNNGFPINELQGNDSIMLSISRKIFIRGHQIIDIEENNHFENDKYIKTDTIGYIFYDLDKQQFARFQTLIPGSDLLSSGKMLKDGSFSNNIEYDPMNGLSDSAWKTADIQVNGKKNILVEFVALDLADTALARRAKFWIDPMVTDFPLQMSYLLSQKNKNGFVYKRQLAMPDEKSVMITSFEYHPAKLPDSLILIFKKWAEAMEENK